MTTTSERAAGSADEELVITRVFDAPRALVFRVWSEAEHLAMWWGAKGTTIEVSRLELRPGGVFHYCQRMPNGAALWGKFVYREIAPPERLVFISSIADAEGNTIRAPWSADWPLEILNSLTLVEEAGKTTLTIRGGPHNATEAERATFAAVRGSIQQGFGGTFDQLAEYLAGVER